MEIVTRIAVPWVVVAKVRSDNASTDRGDVSAGFLLVKLQRKDT